MPDARENQIQTVLDLLEDATSKEVVQDFLRQKGLYHSGTWTEVREKRLIPYLNDHKITIDELIALLGSAEECGDQHIFLHQCTSQDAIEMMDRGRVAATLRAQKLEHLLAGRDIAYATETPTIVEVRFDTADVDVAMVIKVAEVRIRRKLERTRAFHGKFIKIYSDGQVWQRRGHGALEIVASLAFRIASFVIATLRMDIADFSTCAT